MASVVFVAPLGYSHLWAGTVLSAPPPVLPDAPEPNHFSSLVVGLMLDRVLDFFFSMFEPNRDMTGLCVCVCV